MVISEIPNAFACSYISPSMSIETADVHSSRRANLGLQKDNQHYQCKHKTQVFIIISNYRW